MKHEESSKRIRNEAKIIGKWQSEKRKREIIRQQSSKEMKNIEEERKEAISVNKWHRNGISEISAKSGISSISKSATSAKNINNQQKKTKKK